MLAYDAMLFLNYTDPYVDNRPYTQLFLRQDHGKSGPPIEYYQHVRTSKTTKGKRKSARLHDQGHTVDPTLEKRRRSSQRSQQTSSTDSGSQTMSSGQDPHYGWC